MTYIIHDIIHDLTFCDNPQLFVYILCVFLLSETNAILASRI